MDTNFNSEHGFNCKNAEHMPGTNRYIFKYPETWYSSMNDRRLYFGLRSIIVKPEQLFIDFSNLMIARIHDAESGCCLYKTLTYYKTIEVGEDTTKQSIPLAIVRPMDVKGNYLFPDRAYFRTQMVISETETLSDFCQKFNNAYNTFIDNYDKIYEKQSDARRRELKDPSFNYEMVRLLPDAVRAQYDENRNFTLLALGYRGYFLVEYFNEWRERYQNLNPYPVLPNQTTTDEFIVDAFSKDFEILLGLHFPEGLSLNKILSGLAGINRYYKIEMAEQDCEKYGVEFDGVAVLIHETGIGYKRYKEGDPMYFNMLQKTSDVGYTYYVTFRSLTVKNVWSRNDILIRSSIAEMDEKNYLGYSTMNESSGVCIYSTPKMYAIESHDHKFWIDLYDSLQESPIELPEKVVLIIEAILYQNMKEFDTRG